VRPDALVLILSGIARAAEVSATGHLGLAFFAPKLIPDSQYGDLFLVSVPVGALFGTAVAAGILWRYRATVPFLRFFKSWCVATVAGFPAGWMAAMMFSFGPPEVIVVMYVSQLVGLFGLLIYLLVVRPKIL
jgi:hypothetical protein